MMSLMLKVVWEGGKVVFLEGLKEKKKKKKKFEK